MTAVRVVLMTAPDESTALSISRTLVAERLVACGNLVVGARSIFRWEGEVEDERETLVVYKTTGARVEAILRRIPEIHPYDVPEILVLDVDGGHAGYLSWVADETEPRAETNELE